MQLELLCKVVLAVSAQARLVLRIWLRYGKEFEALETALYQNKLVSVGVFQRMRQSRDDRAICPMCGEELFISAATSVVKTASFNHRPRMPGEIPCALSYPYHPSYSWLHNVDPELIEAREEALKNKFYQEENLNRAFSFLSSVVGKGGMTGTVFALLLSKANKFGIWKYAGMPVWAVPYVLLTFMDFIVRPEGKRPYMVRFILNKPPRSKLNTTWLRPEQCSLEKWFVKKGKADRLVDKGKVSQARGGVVATLSTQSKIPNPLPFSKELYLDITSNTAWIASSLRDVFKEMAMEPVAEECDAISSAPTPSVMGAEPSGGRPSAGHQAAERPLVHPITHPLPTQTGRPQIESVVQSPAASVVRPRAVPDKAVAKSNIDILQVSTAASTPVSETLHTLECPPTPAPPMTSRPPQRPTLPLSDLLLDIDRTVHPSEKRFAGRQQPIRAIDAKTQVPLSLLQRVIQKVRRVFSF